MDFFSNSKKGAHPKAKRLMNEDFFWSPIAEAGPFGSDSGSEAAEGFNEWRKLNKTADPVDYLRELLPSWGFPLFDWNELDPIKINDYIHIRADTNSITEQVDQLREALNNSPTGLDGGVSDQSLQDIIHKSAEGMGAIY